MKISVVMTYHNRKQMLDLTLRTISASQFKDFEVVIVDDASRDDQRIDDLVGRFNFSIRLIRIDPSNKSWSNPCVPYNIGFDNATGDIVVLQNAECVHVGDVLSHAAINTTADNYLSYAAYCVSDHVTHKLVAMSGAEDLRSRILNHIQPLSNIGPPNSDPKGWMAWFNHARIRPIGYHWCCSIMKDNLEKLNGFDERFKDGIGWDDPDLVRRVKRLGLKVEFFDENTPFVVHLCHEANHVDWDVKFRKNETLYYQTESESSHKGTRCNINLCNHRS